MDKADGVESPGVYPKLQGFPGAEAHWKPTLQTPVLGGRLLYPSKDDHNF